ncbi:FimV/HubP family polar landmark protein [Caballeronia sp. LZ062]|uniref:FimV/HubP family polar landmark protein n=1 Tax=unclassified Caballeronia TaxID=2646786 RepID=UPI002858122A|nr:MULTISPECIES: FimV/HubP family polar landmark protein [unclassified Caballeronia]MDR5856973.1 FimV/HubP family polar landmark protein [Caballeronia sp. LZ050]MDR5869630.1 FimV/HubP family polar landmark protein [Caballeronia sp. LZ062]
MIRRPRRSFIPSSRAALAAASVAMSAALWTNSGAALAQASGAAADAGASSASVSADAPVQRYAVKPGQSLSDIAGELTGSKERAVREKMARALFDANPNAFAGHDINRLKLGAVLNVPGTDSGAASAGAAASAPAPQAVQQNAPVANPASAAQAAPGADTASAASAVEPAASEPASASAALQAPEPAPAVAPVTSAPTHETAPQARTGFDPKLIALVLAVLAVLLFFVLRRNKRRAEGGAEAQARQQPAAPVSAPVPPRPESAANLEGTAVERDQSELNAVAASLESYEAAQSFAAPSEDDAPDSVEARETHADHPNRTEPSAPFIPNPPAAAHAAFVPPLSHAGMSDAEAHEAHAREVAAREAAAREAEKWEAEEREAAARQAAAREAEEREVRAREAAAREALERESAGRDEASREAAAQEAQALEAREAAAREIIAREAELRQAQALAAQQHAAEERAAEQRAVEEQAARDAHEHEVASDDEPSSGDRFPMPKFPTEAVQALDSLDMSLPPRMDLTLAPPSDDHAAHEVPASAGHEPFVPQPIAEPDAAHEAQAFALPSVADEVQSSAAAQIEAGTAGAPAVAGLGATQFGPLSLDFNLDLPSSQTEPLPALTAAQLATIARNKLELAVEYIELGDLSGARTLLQEVIASNDQATRQQAAGLLSTLAPHS